MEDVLLSNIKRHIGISLCDEEVIRSLLFSRPFSKGQLITTAGKVNRYTNFIINGAVRVHYIDTNGQEHVVQLGIKDWWGG